jgi:hypothetical protein
MSILRSSVLARLLLAGVLMVLVGTVPACQKKETPAPKPAAPAVTPATPPKPATPPAAAPAPAKPGGATPAPAPAPAPTTPAPAR